ncbi:MAG: hypothetical protein N4A70_09470 [Pelagimonas sp.]|jgi:hypothetical protein|nr:hypothetical protein [Pelagimonas sp.]
MSDTSNDLTSIIVQKKIGSHACAMVRHRKMRSMILAMSSIIILGLSACGDDRPPLPNDAELTKLIGVGSTGSTRTHLLSASCAYADPPRSARTDEWMAECEYKVNIEKWDFQARRYKAPVKQDRQFILLWKENVTHDGQGRWQAGRR